LNLGKHGWIKLWILFLQKLKHCLGTILTIPTLNCFPSYFTNLFRLHRRDLSDFDNFLGSVRINVFVVFQHCS
jgi:hypothetical protein